MIAATENQTAPVTAAVWTGFAMMCIGMFMAVLDVQVVATSLPTIQQALNIAQEQMSWIQTAYLIAEIISNSAYGFSDASTHDAMAICRCRVCVHPCIDCMRCQRELLVSDCVSRTARLFRRHANSGGLLGNFSAFSVRLQPLATMIAGVLAVLAPTVGPVVGGWITETYSWPWLFLINVLPGIIAAIVASVSLPKERASFDQLRHLDVTSLALGAISLAALEIAIKEAPKRGWTSLLAVGLLCLCLVTAVGFVFRTLRSPKPLVDLRTFRDRNFSIGCLLSFVLGMGLFGSVYLMPVFLAYVRAHNALEIGKIMLVTGVANLLLLQSRHFWFAGLTIVS